jgi:predicted permease
MYDTLFSFVLIILVGALFKSFGVGKENAESIRKTINITVFNIFLPALCVKTVYLSKIDRELFLVPAVAGITVLSSLLLSFGVYHFLGKKIGLKASETGVLIISATFGNVTYLGMPVLTSLYGEEAAKYAIFYDLFATTPLLWLVGVPLATRYGDGKIAITDSLKNIISLPPIWAIIIGMILNFFDIPLTNLLMKTLDMFSSLVILLMIFSIGLTITIQKIKNIPIVIPAIIIKLVIVPFISFIIASFIGLKEKALSSCIIEGAMPTMVLSLLISAQYKLDTQLSAFIIVVTTILSFFTLPIVIHLTKFLA